MAYTAALFIGAGIAGPAAAMVLQKAGIDAIVYEAHSTSAAGIGEFLTLDTNGVSALRTLEADVHATSRLAIVIVRPPMVVQSAPVLYSTGAHPLADAAVMVAR